MAQRRTPGLIKRGGVWHIDKIVRGTRIRESTGTGDLAEAEKFLACKTEELRQVSIYGVRPKRSFRQAATRYLNEADKVSLDDDALHLRQLDPFIGDLPLEAVHMGTLQAFIESRKGDGVKKRTINYALQTVRHILNICAGEWLDESGRPWLDRAPKIKMLRETDKREPYPLSWEEQSKLFNEMPPFLLKMALFTVNTGCRDSEVCGLRWDYEVEVPELNTTVFIIPAEAVKNRQDRLVVLNRVALAVVEEQRGKHLSHVFTNSKGGPMVRMCREAWRTARKKAEMPDVRVHDLRHTFGRRLRSGGVSFEDRQDLLGHKSGRITTHYSQAELENLIAAANTVCGENSRNSPTMVLLKKKTRHLRVVNAS